MTQQTITFTHADMEHSYSFTATDHQWQATFLADGQTFELHYHPEESMVLVYTQDEFGNLVVNSQQTVLARTLNDIPPFTLDADAYHQEKKMAALLGLDSPIADIPATMVGLSEADVKRLIWVAENLVYWYPEIADRLTDAENSVLRMVVEKAQQVIDRQS